MQIDPVCGMQVDEEKGLKAEKDGKTWYFCSDYCRKKFLGEEPDARTEHTMEYFCPMCPGVESNVPASCPKCGMALERSASAAGDDNTELREMTRRFWIGAILSTPVFILAMSHLAPWLHVNDYIPPIVSSWIQLVLATPVVFWVGAPLLQRAWRSFRTLQLNMFSLIALGVITAYAYSVMATLFPGMFPASFIHHGAVGVYFEAAAVITVLVLLGQVMELKARSRTGIAIRALLSLAPNSARRVTGDVEEDVPLEQVKVGDVLRVRPGDRIPVDGSVISGRSFVDESMITGEPEPVGKSAEAKVSAGTINGSGSFLMRAEKVGSDTLLAHIIKIVAEAQRSRAPIQRLADKVAARFVPSVVAIAVLTFVVWLLVGPEPRLAFALVNSVAVLIIACPCALGLATPMSITVGVGRGAQAGVLIRNAEALEVLGKVDTVVIDKTGTLTEGHPRLTKTIPLEPYSENELLRVAAAVEQHSEHPLGESIVKAARELGLNLPEGSDFESTTGGGVTAVINGRRIRVGTRAFLDHAGVQSLDVFHTLATRLQEEGHSTVYVAEEQRMIGMLGISDPIKNTTPHAVDEIRDMGLDIILLTGDQRLTAEAVARRLGISKVMPQVLPEDKHAKIRELRAAGRTVVMAGDGINDAPALAMADVGIAMGTGTDVAMESAGVTLVKGDLRGIAKAIKLSRSVMRNIRQNLFFAFVYNSLGIPIAAGLLYPFFGWLLSPIVAGVAMSFSSVSVISNALRLRRVKL